MGAMGKARRVECPVCCRAGGTRFEVLYIRTLGYHTERFTRRDLWINIGLGTDARKLMVMAVIDRQGAPSRWAR